MASKNRIKESYGDKVFLTFIYILLTAVLIVILYPLVYIASASLSSPLAVSSGKVWLWPVNFSLAGYEAVFRNPQVVLGYANSFFYTIFGTLISTTLTVLVAYPLSRRSFYGRNVLMIFIVITMLFNGGLIPEYLIVKQFGMVDTRWALLIPKAIAVWQIIIARTFFQSTIPDELVEASELDGCSDLRFLGSIVLPLSKPIIAVVALMYGIYQWNTYFDALIYLKTQALYPLQLVLRNILILNTVSGGNIDAAELLKRRDVADLMKYSLIVVACLPVLVVYPFIQRFFVKGMLIGSVKG
ncbi:ABC transporter permease subunit [Cohnella zeiphila]|uniref:Carbohydrate ABC transporter permease n=1 Tax=Cohnella zeiphila TaxID=2761120 RepID=A0A7X0W067_9BACL|nr:carbohydrate ABC transporter permease [Cohnella zeiphila]